MLTNTRKDLRQQVLPGGCNKKGKMENRVTKYWTPEDEDLYESYLASCHTFAERDLMMMPRDHLKYDGRTREGKRAIAQGRLRLVTATDENPEELAKLEAQLGGDGSDFEAYRLKRLKKRRAEIREKGIKRSELESSKAIS